MMNSPNNSTASNTVPAAQNEVIHTVGTLSYNNRQLVILFIWLMWNDFGITLIEAIGSLNSVMMRDHGATFAQMALLGSIGGFLNPFINPWVSTWSDRHRGPHGRRRPFLLIATPIFAMFLMAVPFMPDFYYYLEQYPVMVKLFSHIPMNGPAFFIGVCGLIAGMFNAVVLAIFSYLYWDVVPENVLGRFNSMKANVALIAGLVWSFFIYGHAQHNMKAVYVGTGIFSLTIYLLSTWKVKEGEYPPPDEHKKGGILAPFRAYFVECFSDSYYIWIFFASFMYQLGNLGGGYQFFYLYNDLHLELSVLGPVDGWGKLVTTGFGLLLGFKLGKLADRLNSVKVSGPSYLILALIPLWAFFFVHDRNTYLISVCVRNVANFVQGTLIAAFVLEVFPREKLGQFCSAQAVFYQFLNNLLNPFVGMFFDWLKYNRFGFVWMSCFYFLSGLTYLKVYSNWKKRSGKSGHVPAPHAG